MIVYWNLLIIIEMAFTLTQVHVGRDALVMPDTIQ